MVLPATVFPAVPPPAGAAVRQAVAGQACQAAPIADVPRRLPPPSTATALEFGDLGPLLRGQIRPRAVCHGEWAGAVGLLALSDDWFLVLSLMRIDVMISRSRSRWPVRPLIDLKSLRHLDCLLQVKTIVDSCHFVRGFCDRGSTFHVLP